MNNIIGSWTKESLLIKQDLTDYIFNKRQGIIAQDASLPHDKNYLTHPRYWEYATALEITDPCDNDILDVGGLNNVVGWYLRDNKNCLVTQVGLCNNDLNNLQLNKQKFGAHDIEGKCVDIRNFSCDKQFDIVYSFNVIEHVREYAKAEKTSWRMGATTYWGTFSECEDYASAKEVEFVQAMTKFVKPGGLLCITFDYKHHGGWKPQHKCAYMRDPDDIKERIVKPSKLAVVGKTDFDLIFPVDCNPAASTGIILLRKEA